jgi:hypothetical protein
LVFYYLFITFFFFFLKWYIPRRFYLITKYNGGISIAGQLDHSCVQLLVDSSSIGGFG